MPVRARSVRWAAPALTLALLAGCGGGETEADRPLELDGTPSTSASADPADDEEQLAQLMNGLEKAFLRLQRTEAGDGSFDGVLTPDLAEEFLENYRENVYDNGVELLGRWEYEIGSIDVEGEEATVGACQDGREVFFVEADQGIGEGQASQGTEPITVSAVRTESGWLISDFETGEGTC